MPRRSSRQTVEWGVASRCRLGEETNGDVGVVILLPEGALVAGIDGLGHGSEAASAAHAAADVVRRATSRDLVTLVRSCHAALQDTRGAAISLAFVSPAEAGVTWLGVGNVEGRVLSGSPSEMRPKASLALGSGVAGHDLPRVSTTTLDVRPGDVLCFATDGIDAAFGDSLDLSGSPKAISERIVADHWTARDDAVVVALRYLGPRP